MTVRDETERAAPARERRRIDRRRFLIASAGGLAVAGVHAPAASAATDDDLAYGNFGLAAEFLASDYYARALQGAKLDAAVRPALRRGRAVAGLHARTFSEMLAGAGDAPAASEDFTFEWPSGTFATAARTRSTGLVMLRAMLGAYQGASVGASAQYRTLFASVAASTAQQIGSLAPTAGAIEPFPVALDLEAASAALESFLG